MTVALEIKSVSHKFGEFTALDDVSLNINSGDFTVLLGLTVLVKRYILLLQDFIIITLVLVKFMVLMSEKTREYS